MDNKEKLDIGLIALVALYNLGVSVVAVLWIFTNKFAKCKSQLGILEEFNINESVTYGLFLAGALGGSFYCLRALYQRIGEAYTPIDGKSEPANGINMRAWFFWYLYRPFQGGVLALVIMVLSKGSLLSLGDGEQEFDFESYSVMIGLGFLAGFGAHELIHKIQELIQVLFAKSKLKPSNSKQKVKENNGEE